MSYGSAEHYWGCKLSAKDSKKEYQYKSEDGETEGSKILLKRVWLDHDSADSETVVEMETVMYNDDAIKQSLGLLTKSNPSLTLDFTVSAEDTKFRLIRGDGPVHLGGSLLIDMGFDPEDMDDEDTDDPMEDSEEEEEEEVEDDVKAKNGDLRKKIEAVRKAGEKSKLPAKNGDKPSKKPKVEPEDDEDDDDDNEDDEEEDSPPPKKEVKKILPQSVNKNGSASKVKPGKYEKSLNKKAK